MSKWNTRALLAVGAALTFSASGPLLAQGSATATQPLALSAFGAATGNFTGLLGGRNASITAGADLSFLTYRLLRPSFEIRGTYPIDSGHIVGEKNILAGLKVERQFGSLHPYVDFLAGRGELDYQSGGFQVDNFIFLYSSGLVYSPGIGLDYDLSPQWSIKADAQLQHYTTPVTASGSLWSKPISIGVLYRFDFNHKYKRDRRR